jgi:bla regulator protein blaR1
MKTSYFLNDAVIHLLQSTLFAAFAWLLTMTLLRRNRARVRYGVWLAASLKFLIPFAALIGLGRDLGRWLGLMKLAAPATQVGLYYAMDAVSRRIAPPLVPSAVRPAAALPGMHLSLVLFLLSILLWICGVLFVAFRCSTSWRKVHSAARGATLLRTFEGIPVLSSPVLRDRGVEPGVFGIWRAVVLVPEGITERLTPEQFEAVLAHECCHARRRDNLAAAIHMGVEALFWFYPLVWWLGHRMIEERERACDEEVLLRSDADKYAEGILNVCRFYVESPLRCVAGITGANLKRRIEEIMKNRAALDLNWARAVVLAVAGSAAIIGPLAIGLLRTPLSQAQTISPFDGVMRTSVGKQFEVATIRENRKDDEHRWRLGPPQHGSILIDNLQLHRIIASSFQIQDTRVFGPEWLNTTRYDIVAKGPDPTMTNPEVWEMMRSLLAERFHLKYHVESRQLPLYVLTVAKGGPKLKRPEDGPCAEKIKAGENCASIGPIAPFAAGITNTTIGALVSALARSIQDRPIVDKTGLTGKYDAVVRWMPPNMKPEDLANIPPDQRPDDVPLTTALEEQLGLKLTAERGPIDVLVVDSIEKPADVAGENQPVIDDRLLKAKPVIDDRLIK